MTPMIPCHAGSAPWKVEQEAPHPQVPRPGWDIPPGGGGEHRQAAAGVLSPTPPVAPFQVKVQETGWTLGHGACLRVGGTLVPDPGWLEYRRVPVGPGWGEAKELFP